MEGERWKDEDTNRGIVAGASPVLGRFCRRRTLLDFLHFKPPPWRRIGLRLPHHPHTPLIHFKKDKIITETTSINT